MEQALFALLGGFCMAGVATVFFPAPTGERPEPGFSAPPWWWPESLEELPGE